MRDFVILRVFLSQGEITKFKFVLTKCWCIWTRAHGNERYTCLSHKKIDTFAKPSEIARLSTWYIYLISLWKWNIFWFSGTPVRITAGRVMPNEIDPLSKRNFPLCMSSIQNIHTTPRIHTKTISDQFDFLKRSTKI